MTAPAELPAVTLARIETKLDAVISAGSDHETRLRVLEGQQAALLDLPKRVSVLESRQWPLPSAAVVLSVAGVIIQIIAR